MRPLLPLLLCAALPLAALAASPKKKSPAAAQAKAKPEPEQPKGVARDAALIKPSLVKITQVGREGIEGLGTGFVISADGLIATNMHVIGRGKKLSVETSDGKRFDVQEVHAWDIDLDLAILRVKATGLKPLVLGDSDKVEQGESIVAMGNPQGLDFSVVEGVVSAIRELDDAPLPMIQIAMPIERGNSGGPVVDRQQRVLGIITLKSVKTDNLGFATPVNALKRLLEDPNAVPMANWISIDTFDSKRWQPVMGGEWSQQGGVMNVQSLGDGFGGRALCLWQADEPKSDSYDVTVTVRLDDEAGAAGLVFCSDGSDTHYGFYPTAGKLRLTRFEGPVVNDWTILHDSEVEAYRPGDWNTLRVRVEKDRLRCFVNEVLVVEMAETALRGGKVGLCKFRQTKAEFRGFRWAPDTLAKAVPEAVKAKLGAAIVALTSKADGQTNAPSKELSQEPALARKLIDERIRKLELETIALRSLSERVHREHIAAALAAEIAKPEDKISLFKAALLIARHDNAELDTEPYEAAVARMAEALREDKAIKAGGKAAVQRLSAFLFKENGFHGTRSFDYDNKSNSYINETLDDRDGLPITLSVLFIELASRLGVKDVFGVGWPQHFMVGYKDGESTRLLDVFDGGSEPELPEKLDAEMLEMMKPAKKKDIVTRMITNLMTRSNEEVGRQYRDLILAAEPDSPQHRFERLLDRQRLKDFAGARDDAKWLLDHPPEGVPEDALLELSRLYQSLNEKVK